MNQKNVEALTQIMVEATKCPEQWGPVIWTGPDSARALALWLSSRGVLVPSALTDEECMAMGTPFIPPVVRRRIKDIATGDAGE